MPAENGLLPHGLKPTMVIGSRALGKVILEAAIAVVANFAASAVFPLIARFRFATMGERHNVRHGSFAWSAGRQERALRPVLKTGRGEH
jgi:hypothetical protein